MTAHHSNGWEKPSLGQNNLFLTDHLPISGEVNLKCFYTLLNIKNKNPKTTYAHYLRHDQGGETPLHLAATNGHLEICKLIVENMDEQGDKNPKNNFGNTPLHYAAADGHFEICKLLAEKIVNKNPENNLRKTPAQIADMNGYKSICELFKT